MAHTVVDFWRMIWFEKCPIIVMITKLKEKSKVGIKIFIFKRNSVVEWQSEQKQIEAQKFQYV